MTHGQAILAHTEALELVDAIYAATVQSEGSEARERNIIKAKERVARIAELLGDKATADDLRRAA